MPTEKDETKRSVEEARREERREREVRGQKDRQIMGLAPGLLV